MASTDEMATFVQVIDGGSLSAAARHLGVPRSTVSRQLARLEERLNVRLLQRTTRTIHLTEAGTEYYRRARSIVGDIREAEEAVSQLDGVPRGLLRISVPSGGGSERSSALMTGFMKMYPEVTLEVVHDNRRVDLIAEGFDIALRGGNNPDSSLIARRIGTAMRLCVASPAYLDEHGRPQKPEDLVNHACLRGTMDNHIERSWGLFAGGRISVDGPLVSSSVSLLVDSALAGLGIACVPIIGYRELLRSKELELVLTDTVGSTGSLQIVYPAREHLPAKVRAFIDYAVPLLIEMLAPPEGCPDHC